MKRIKSSIGGVVVASLVVGGALVALAAPADAAVTALPKDPSSIGSLALYNSAGKQITSGSISSLIPLVKGAKVARAGDTKASLYGYQVTSGAAGSWSGELLAGPSAIPSSGKVSFAGAATSATVHTLALDFPNSANGGIYELRLATSQPGSPANAKYDSTYIAVIGSTWAQLPVKTTATLKVSKAKIKKGQKLTLSVTVGPSFSAGTVTFYNGKAKLKAVTVKKAKASLVITSLAVGGHSLKATFSPASASTAIYATSTSKTVKVTVTK